MEIIKKKKRNDSHPYIPELEELYRGGRITRREFLRNATILGMSLVSASSFLAACAREEATTAPPTEAPTAAPEPTAPAPAGPKRGGELVYHHQVQDLTDPHACQWIQFDIIMNVAEYLIDSNQDGALVPTLCEKWEPSDDVKTWTFHIREGVKFNHGPELTADDVVWNFKRWLDPDVGCPLTATLTNYMTENDIEKVDDYTVKLHLNQPYAGLIAQISGGSFAAHILPRDWEGDWIKQPYGTGPFTLEEFALDERAVVKRREGYWANGADGKPLPYLDSIRYVYIGEDMAPLIAALQTGDLDMVMINAQSVELVEGTEIVVDTHESAFAYVYKMRSDEKGAFNDVRLRQAVKVCQDREQIQENVWKGFGVVAQDHHVAPVHPVYCPVETPKRDIEKAKALLAEAGHPDGWTIPLSIPDSPTYKDYAQMLKDQAAPAGLNIELDVMPSPLYWEQWTEQDFGVVPWAHRPSAEMILETMYRCGAAWNDSHWCDEEFDELLTEAGRTVEVEKRREIMCKIEKIQQERGPTAIPVFADQLRAHRPRVKNFRTSAATHTFLKEVWLDEEA